MNTTTMIIIGLAGLYLLVSAFLNLDFLLNRQRNAWLVETLGRTGARIVFGVLGVILIALSAYNWFFR